MPRRAPSPTFGIPKVAAQPGAATGTWTSHCGRDDNGRHRNADNVVLQPGKVGGAHHTHEYVGNMSTNALSTGTSLAAASTKCDRDDLSTYFWPAVRLVNERGPDAAAVGGGRDGNHGQVVRVLEFPRQAA